MLIALTFLTIPGASASELILTNLTANPSSILVQPGNSTINFTINNAVGLVTLEIVDAYSMPVRTVKMGRLNPGNYTYYWDCMNESKMPVPNGSYTVMVTATVDSYINGTFTGRPSAIDGIFNRPNSIAVDSDGNVYVAEYGSNSIRVYDNDGRQIASWGSRGTGESVGKAL